MSTADNKALVHRYVEEVINGGNVDGLGSFVTPDFRRYLSPESTALSPDEQKQRLAGMHLAFPDLHLAIEGLVAEGDRVAFRGTLSGTHQGTFLGIPPTGKHIRVFASDTVRVEGGRFAEHWGGPDLFAALKQLGAVFSAATPSND